MRSNVDDRQQYYSFLIAAVIGSAVVPTLIANAFFLPHHLVRQAREQAQAEAASAIPPKTAPAAHSKS